MISLGTKKKVGIRILNQHTVQLRFMIKPLLFPSNVVDRSLKMVVVLKYSAKLFSRSRRISANRSQPFLEHQAPANKAHWLRIFFGEVPYLCWRALLHSLGNIKCILEPQRLYGISVKDRFTLYKKALKAYSMVLMKPTGYWT